MSVYRRTIPELLARYELEPTLRDVYVEGPLDASLLRWFCRHCDLSDVAVYEIDTVEVDDGDVVAEGLPTGMWGRVVWLSLDMGRHLPAESIQVTMVADRDVAGLLGTLPDHPNLVYTDHSCIEMYLIAEKPLQKFLDLVAGGVPHSARDLRTILGSVTLEAALLRAAKLRLDLSLPHLSLDRFCTIVDGELVFDRSEMISRTAIVGGLAERRADLEAEIENLRRIAGRDFQAIASGHDFVELLALYLRRVARVSGYRTAFVQRALLGCVEHSSLRSEPMFQTLERRLAA